MLMNLKIWIGKWYWGLFFINLHNVRKLNIKISMWLFLFLIQSNCQLIVLRDILRAIFSHNYCWLYFKLTSFLWIRFTFSGEQNTFWKSSIAESNILKHHIIIDYLFHYSISWYPSMNANSKKFLASFHWHATQDPIR